ncbi:MAG: primosomal protein N' [Clostridia bacterium]|nr:primosomal protein N' [Clostridia bacterium]
MYAEVIVDIASSEVDRIFEYSVDESVYEGSRVIVPFGVKKIEGIVMKIKDNCTYEPEKVKSVISVIEDIPALTRECLQMVYDIKERYHVPAALALRLFLPAEMRRGRVKPKTSVYYELSASYSTAEVLSKVGSRAPNQRGIVEFLIENKRCNSPELRAKFGDAAVRALLCKGFLSEKTERTHRNPYTDLDSKSKSVVLIDQQQRAVDAIELTDKKVSLLHGVTGSGKTEVYLNLIKSVVDEGKTAIMLVPEISLTPQMLSQLRARFGNNAAILHSGLSEGERYDEWWRLRSGEARIAIGARSAVFAPVENLGLIIIDEEHDGSYSSDTSPRYNTVDVAKFRCGLNENCKIVLGSATPSIESFVKASSGEYNLVVMPNRINKKPLPEIIISDMRKEVRRGNNTPFSSALREEIKECLQNGNQAIIFLNRRGYSQTVICQECGYVAKCEACDVSLTYHMDSNVLKCHYCNATYKMLTACPECGSQYIRYGGTGTERVVQELSKVFPEAKILRMDNDTTRNKEGHFKILKDFSAKKADILVGTQMIAKGHDFPSVTLVGILDADMSLYFSDYRSRERTFQLLTQVSGRSGRADKKGKVVLQTYCPDNPVLQYAIRYDYNSFIEAESRLRKATGFPPYADIVRVMVVAEDDAKAIEVLRELYLAMDNIKRDNSSDFIFFNKMKSPIKRMQNKYRYQVLMRVYSGNDKLKNQIYQTALSFKTRDVAVYVEENPNNLT